MPLTINIGLSRKTSHNYQSAGLSINLAAELDQTLLTRPADLQTRIARLYAQAEHALEQQAQRMNPADPARPNRGRHDAPESPDAGEQRPATPSQQRAINAICRRLGIDPVSAAHQELGVEFETLTVGEASRLIARLERYDVPAGDDNGHAR